MAIKEKELNLNRDKLKLKEDELRRRSKELDIREQELKKLSQHLARMKIELENRLGIENETPNLDVTMLMSPMEKRLRTPKQINNSRMSISPLMPDKKLNHRIFQLRNE